MAWSLLARAVRVGAVMPKRTVPKHGGPGLEALHRVRYNTTIFGKLNYQATPPTPKLSEKMSHKNQMHSESIVSEVMTTTQKSNYCNEKLPRGNSTNNTTTRRQKFPHAHSTDVT
eukprot:2166346-Amphidinium_carterae.1